MSWIEWNDALSVGVADIDKQHKKLISLLNELYDAMDDDKDKIVIGKIIRELKDYTVYHFATEEKFFKTLNYHNVDQHIKAHRGFVEKINKFESDYKEKKQDISEEIMDFLKDWLINHIMKDDQSYANYYIA